MAAQPAAQAAAERGRYSYQIGCPGGVQRAVALLITPENSYEKIFLFFYFFPSFPTFLNFFLREKMRIWSKRSTSRALQPFRVGSDDARNGELELAVSAEKGKRTTQGDCATSRTVTALPSIGN